jgi:Mrp family chromosome partitioning ATPase
LIPIESIKNKKEEVKKSMKVITCFSYKGGAGRTVAAANIATALASIKEAAAIKKPLKRKVALLDLDVFSAGTHRVFGISSQELMEKLGFGVQDYLLEQIEPGVHLKENALTFSKGSKIPLIIDGGANRCDKNFTFFPAKPRPDQRFIVQNFMRIFYSN